MTTKDEEVPRTVSAPPFSSQLSSLGHNKFQLSSNSTSLAELADQDPACHWSTMLSGLLAVNMILLGIALVSASVFNRVDVTSNHLQIYLIVIMLLSTLWMLYYIAYTTREDHAVLYKDVHAGPIWLRGGLILFGLCSLVMDIFKIALYVGYLHCDSPVKIVFPVIQSVFIFVQTYFLWLHAKDCVQLQRSITRCGLMLTLATNLMLWMTAVTEESLHQTVLHPLNTTSRVSSSSNTAIRASSNSDCDCSHSACSIFEKASNYLYPFNIEYSLFASAMTYVMWKNVGRLVDEHHHGPHSPHLRFNLRNVLLGPITGLLVFVAGLVTFIMYKVDVEEGDHGRRQAALRMHFIMYLVAYVLMMACAGAGWVLYGLDPREHVSGKNPTRSLDVGLLLGSSIGQFAICYFTIVAVVATGSESDIDALNLCCSVLAVVQLCLQHRFIVEGLHRQPYCPGDKQMGQVLANPHAVHPHNNSQLGMAKSGSVVTCEASNPTVSSSPPPHCPAQMSWKRRALKEICVFLMLSNITLWIMPAFGARPQFVNPHGHTFYEKSMWVTVINIGLPFGIFYRMHSVASLFEVYILS